MRTVLIFAHECAPYNRPESTIGAQRPAQFAKHLPHFGWRAIVICRDATQEGAWTCVDKGAIDHLVEDALTTNTDVSVAIATPSLETDGPLDAVWRQLGPGAVRQGLTLLKFFTGDVSQSWQPCAWAAAQAVAARVRIDVCIGEHSPDAGLFLARRFAVAQCLPWVADFRDPAVLQHPPLAQSLRRPLLRHQLRTASCLVNVNPVWTALDEREYGRPAVCIPNGFDPTEFERNVVHDSTQGLTVTYTGNINAGTVDPLRGLRLFLEALAWRENGGMGERLQVTFRYFGNHHARVRELASACGVADHVVARPTVPRTKSIDRLMSSDVLLLLSVSDTRHESRYYRKGFYPGKVFEYFGAGRPILCVPGDGGQLESLLCETLTGVVCGSIDAIAANLSELGAAKRRTGRCPYNPNTAAVGRYTRQAGARRLVACLNEVTRS